MKGLNLFSGCFNIIQIWLRRLVRSLKKKRIFCARISQRCFSWWYYTHQIYTNDIASTRGASCASDASAGDAAAKEKRRETTFLSFHRIGRLMIIEIRFVMHRAPRLHALLHAPRYIEWKDKRINSHIPAIRSLSSPLLILRSSSRLRLSFDLFHYFIFLFISYCVHSVVQ